MPTDRPPFKISERLKELRELVLGGYDPEDFDPTDDAAIGREIQEYRNTLARLAGVHQNAGRVRGWGHLTNPDLTRHIRRSMSGDSSTGQGVLPVPTASGQTVEAGEPDGEPEPVRVGRSRQPKKE